jgi:dihydrofolate reductase
MSTVISNLTITADGYAAGLDQTEQRPFGDDGGDGWGDRLHAWAFDDREGNEEEAALLAAADAFIMGRNMFGPVRGEWDREWNGWWGDDPPYHGPVFVLTHHARDPQSMHGGATTINQYLAAGMVDELRLHIVPFTLGAGTRLFEGVPPLNLEQVSARASRTVTHVTYRVLNAGS